MTLSLKWIRENDLYGWHPSNAFHVIRLVAQEERPSSHEDWAREGRGKETWFLVEVENDAVR